MAEFRLTQISDTHLARRLTKLTVNFERIAGYIEQLGTSNTATIGQKNGNNNQATVQTGKFNSVLSAQNGAAAGATANNSANVQTGNDNTALISQKNGSNNQATNQAGRANAVTTSQVSNLPTGLNNSGNVQAGDFNTAMTTQTNSAPNPLATSVNYANDSMSAQYGIGNTVIAKQTGGQNNQGTVQAGTDNLATVTQSDKAITPAAGPVVGGANTSFTGQYGDNNTVTTTQKTADVSGGFGPQDGYGNASASLQYGTNNIATIKQNGSADTAQGTFNNSATLQIGDSNVVSVKQGGNTAGNFGATTAAQAANDTNGSYVSQTGSQNGATVNQANGGNTQATVQVGSLNTASVNQATQTFGRSEERRVGKEC